MIRAVPRDEVTAALEELRAAGLVVLGSDGRYRLTEAGKVWALNEGPGINRSTARLNG